MTERDILAQAAGLGAPWRDRAAEIEEAAAQARKISGGFAPPPDETAEPMPAYAVPQPKGRRA